LSLALSAVGSAAGLLTSIPFVNSLWPSAKARALSAPIEVDLAGLAPGQVGAYPYRGATVLVLRRTPAMLAQLDSMADHRTDAGAVADPAYVDANHRAINPEYLVVSGVCPHLGCVPAQTGAVGKRIAGEWWTAGFICPCHVSGFDNTGRVVKGPAPRNLSIPPHRYVSPTRLIIGEPTQIT
jgi:ubiquinol-cytochrome c reductase iron-sulfur subunit